MIIRYDDPRVLSAGNEAFGAFVRALGWADVHGVDVVPMVAARLFGRERVWARLEAAALVVRLATGYELHGDGPPPPPSPPAASTPPSAPRADEVGLSPAALRKRRERERKRDMSRVTDRDMSRPESVTAAPDVTAPGRDIPRAPLSLFSSAVSSADPEKKEPENRERDARTSGVTSSVTERDGVTEVTPGRGSKLPAYTDPIPPFVALVLSTWAMTNGVTLDAKTEWEGFLANAHKRRDDGLRAGAGEHDFRGWVAGSVKRHQTNGPRAKPRGPRGIVQGGPSRGPSLSFDDNETDYGMPPLATAEGE